MSSSHVLSQGDRLERLRHSAAHIMAEAVLSMFPDAKLGIGPPIETGFYYDFELPRPLAMEDLQIIQRKMEKRVKSNVPFVHEEMAKADAQRLFANQPYKLELINEIKEGHVGVYKHADFIDLCQGPHMDRTGQVKAFKLLSLAGAYWRGDETNPMLQRIYGALFETDNELKEHLHRLEEAQRRDHRRLGRELELFSFHEEVGPGLVYWHPKGGLVRSTIEEIWRRAHLKAGYGLVYSPHIGKAALWQTSGHLDFYRENMFTAMDVDGQDYHVKPMNCPFHIQIYQTSLRSYRDLPMRLAELGTVYRYERSGVLHGLLRVRGFTQDDAHIFCRPDQLTEEIDRAVQFARYFLRLFGFQDYRVFISTRPTKYVGDLEHWRRAEEALRGAVTAADLPYDIDEGGGVFYGPKIDVHIKDAIGRLWQLTTIQFDFNMPDRFGLTYIGEDGGQHTPYMVHRALLGSIERFLGVLIEHYAGAFPLWLAPLQAIVIPIADRHNEYAHSVATTLKEKGMRVEVDERSERMQGKIRDAQLKKVPYMLVVGDREMEGGQVSARLLNGDNIGPITTAALAQRLTEEARQDI